MADRLEARSTGPTGSAGSAGRADGGAVERAGPGAGTAGFTLLEALVALTISTVVVLMVMSTFLAQNDFYTQVVRRSEVQETVRSTAEAILSETRGVTQGGMVVADSLRMVVRVPLAMAAVCALRGNDTYVHMPVLTSEIDGGDVTGIGVRDDLGTWTYHPVTWSSALQNPGSAARRCFDEGADTVGAIDEYQTLRLAGIVTPPPDEGDVIMVYQEEEFAFDTSELDPATLALFRGMYGSTLTEFATGISPDAHFRYRVRNSSAWNAAVTGTWLDSIDGVRVVAAGRSRADADGNTYDYDLTVSIPLRNTPE